MKMKQVNINFDVIPSDWIFYNQKHSCCMTKYPDPPYTSKLKKKLADLVKSNGLCDSSWPAWQVNIVGGAGVPIVYVYAYTS